jgi:putative FmdB family regulatory protein
MPIYAYKCPKCGAECDEFNRIDDRHEKSPVCAECGAKTAMMISPVRGSVQENCQYVCPQTGQGVTTHRQRRNILAEHNLVDARDINSSAEREKRRQRKRVKLETAYRECGQVADVATINPREITA